MIYGVMLMSDNPILDLTPAWIEFRTQLKCKLRRLNYEFKPIEFHLSKVFFDIRTEKLVFLCLIVSLFVRVPYWAQLLGWQKSPEAIIALGEENESS